MSSPLAIHSSATIIAGHTNQLENKEDRGGIKISPTTPYFRYYHSADTVDISESAQYLAQQDIASRHVRDVSKVAPVDFDETGWGPDLLDGWDEQTYLKATEDGYTGSVSFTSKYGSKIQISALSNGNGDPTTDLLVTIVRANGDTYQTQLGYALRITETEDSIDFSSSTQGTDGDDIIISKGFAMSGGKGDDTLISVGDPSNFAMDKAFSIKAPVFDVMDGGDGNDTLVSLGAVTQGDLLRTGSGNDKVYLRSYETGRDPHSLDLSEGNNTIVVDQVVAHTYLRITNGGDNTIKIRQLDGDLEAWGQGRNTITIDELNGAMRTGNPKTPRGFHFDAFEDPNIGLENTISVGTLNGTLESNAITKATIQTLNGSLRIVGGSNNTARVEQLNGRLRFNNGTLAFGQTAESSHSTLRNATLTASKLSGILYGNQLTIDADEVQSDLLQVTDSTLRINQFSGNLSLHGDITADIGTLQNSGQLGIWSITDKLKMTIGTMNNVTMYINSGQFDITAREVRNSGVALNMFYKKNAQGTFLADYAEESIFFGKGFTLKNSKNCIQTDNQSVWRAAQRLGVLTALYYLKKFGEVAFDEFGGIHPEFIKKR